MNLDVVDRIENADTGTVTLIVGDRDEPNAPVAMYHYSATPPGHAQMDAAEWDRQTRAHAIALESVARGATAPSVAAAELARGAEPAEAAAPSSAPLGDQERAELEQLRAERAARDAASAERSELEQLRRERAQEQSGA
jgi:hypothetical protein